MKRNRTQHGVSLVEILIGAAIISVGLLALINAYGIYVKFALLNNEKVQVTYLLHEGIEAASLMRDDSWAANISAATTATTSISWNGTKWVMGTTTDEIIDGIFYRNIKLTNVSRDANNRITASGGSNDPNTRLVTVTVSFLQSGATTTESVSKYLINIYNN